MSEFDRPRWIVRSRELLDESAAGLDAATLSRLNRARQAALAQRQRVRAPRWLPAIGLACSGALLLAVVFWAPHRVGAPPPAHATSSASDLDFGGADDNIEFYQNLDFYAWLEAQDADIDG